MVLWVQCVSVVFYGLVRSWLLLSHSGEFQALVHTHMLVGNNLVYHWTHVGVYILVGQDKIPPHKLYSADQGIIARNQLVILLFLE